MQQQQFLRHVVLIQFKTATSPIIKQEIEAAFRALAQQISGIIAYEWGINNSPEALNKNFTHCFFLTFENEAARDNYLPHPAHEVFKERLSPHLEDVLVLDYSTLY